MPIETQYYDVIIIGGGPGGLSSANELVKSGKTVLLLEKNGIIGPKVCAGGMRDSDFKRLELQEELRGCEVDELGYLTVDRKALGQSLLKRLDRNKIDIRTESKVTKIEEGTVIVNGQERIGFKYLIGADGSTSIVRKYLKLKEYYVLIAIQYIIPSSEFHYPEDLIEIRYYYNERLFHSWYAWIFPHKCYFSIGCGCGRGLQAAKRLKENFENWLVEMRINVSEGKAEGFPINCDYKGHEFENIFLVGDAAGLASYETGEGIHQALVSGEEVAKKIIDPKYKSKTMEYLLREKEENRMSFLRRVKGLSRKSESDEEIAENSHLWMDTN